MYQCTRADLPDLTALLLICYAHDPGVDLNSKHVTAPLHVARDIADCAEEFKSRKLPLHGLINNVGVENPNDSKSKEGFDVCSISSYMLIACMLLCCSILTRIWRTAAYTSIQLPGPLLPDSPSA